MFLYKSRESWVWYRGNPFNLEIAVVSPFLLWRRTSVSVLLLCKILAVHRCKFVNLPV